jgi:hypothetical protein
MPIRKTDFLVADHDTPQTVGQCRWLTALYLVSRLAVCNSKPCSRNYKHGATFMVLMSRYATCEEPLTDTHPRDTDSSIACAHQRNDMGPRFIAAIPGA